jgi:hypothetical protein
VAAPLVDSPAAGNLVHDTKSPSPDVVEIALADDSLEPRPLVDHVDQQTVLVKLRVEVDPAPAMRERVRGQFAR